MYQKTLVMIKPDGLKLRINKGKSHDIFVGIAVSELLDHGLIIKKAVTKTLSRQEAENLYKQNIDKWYFARNVDFIISGPVLLMQIEGEDAVWISRDIIESLRESYKFYIDLPKNLIHATDDENLVEHELKSVGF